MDRRHFLMSSAAALGAASNVFGSPNDTVRVACVGIGGRGKDHIGGYSKLDNVEIAAICDVDDSHIANGLKQMERLNKPKPETYKDIRKLLERQDHRRHLDRHAQPLAHADRRSGPARPARTSTSRSRARTIFSKRKQIVAAARKYNRMVQQGSQIRSSRPCRKPCRRCATASSAMSTWRAACATNGATPSATPSPSPVPAGRGLRPVARPRAHAPVHAESLPLQLALVLGLRQRRPRQPGHPPGGYRALGPGREVSRRRSAPWADTSCSTTTRKRPTR